MIPKISFIIPTYNAQVHIEKCLRSIQKQDYPKKNIEILIIDGGSSDRTLEIAKSFDTTILSNRRKLAEYGVQIGVLNAKGDLIVIFAADNELVDDDWIQKVVDVFNSDGDISAVWGRLVSGKNDSALNKYFELIQSDPLNWFLNKNLDKYRTKAQLCYRNCFIFRVDPTKPLVWGANGLVYRTEKIKAIWAQSGYLGDNDAFQYMIEQGNSKVAYLTSSFVYHHHVAKLGDWIRKWKRNFTQHLLDQQKNRNMNWLFVDNFKMRLFFWILYSAVPIFSLSHSIYLFFKDKNVYWFCHSLVSFMQFLTYTALIIFTKKGRNFIKDIVFETDRKVVTF